LGNIAARARDDFRAHWRAALALHLLMNLLGFALITPALGGVVDHLVAGSGEAVVTNYDLARFGLSLRGVLFVLVTAAVTIGIVLAEFAGLSWIAGHAIARRPVTLQGTLGAIARRSLPWLELSTRVFLRLLLWLLPFLAAAGLLWFATLAGHDVNYYLSENPPEWRRAKLVAACLAVAYVLVALRQLARWIFAVPIVLFTAARPAEALRRSVELMRGRSAGVIVRIAAWWLGVTAVMIVLTLAGRQITTATLAWAGIDVHRVLPLVAVFMAVASFTSFLYGALLLGGHQFLVTRLFAEHPDVPWQAIGADDESEDVSRRRARPLLAALAALLVLAAGIGTVLYARLDLKSDVAVTAHRGASLDAPENSMAAFKAALDAGTDYIELDVQRTRDGAVVVIHDGDLLRMAGDPRKVRDLNLADFATIDIGLRRGARFAGERVPTLEEVIALVRGRAKLNVELKYNVPDPQLAPAVIGILRRQDFLDQAVITSLDYAALKQVKALEPRLRTGHIVTASIGNVAKTSADFVSLSSAQATASLVVRAHRGGKEVHVWTVDKPDVMLRMIERDVDNIITNDPARLRRVMQERNALSRAEILGLRLRVLFSEAPPEVETASAVPVQ
jgi:glycerophosphoryl diester phosphodiesterase